MVRAGRMALCNKQQILHGLCTSPWAINSCKGVIDATQSMNEEHANVLLSSLLRTSSGFLNLHAFVPICQASSAYPHERLGCKYTRHNLKGTRPDLKLRVGMHGVVLLKRAGGKRNMRTCIYHRRRKCLLFVPTVQVSHGFSESAHRILHTQPSCCPRLTH